MLVHRGRLSAYTVYLIFSGAASLFLGTIGTINLVYQIEIARLNPLQLVLVGTVLEITAFLCQVPTGVLADIYSRRLSVILGAFLVGAGFTVEGLFPIFSIILLSQVIWGIGITFMDGAEQAWIADEVGEENVGRVFLRSAQIGQFTGLFAAFISVALASIRLNLPVVVGGVLFMLLAIFLLFFMPENNFHPTPREQRQTWREMGNTFLNGMRVVRGSAMLIIILCVALFYGLSSEGYDRLWQAHFVKDFIIPPLGPLKPVVWFGIFSIGGGLISIASTEFVRRRINTTKQRTLIHTLFVINAVGIVCLIVFGLAGNFFLALAAFWGITVFRTVNQPLSTTWLTQNINAKVRATVISMQGQVDAFGQIVGGPPVGYIGTAFSIRVAMIAVSIILSPVLLLFAYASRQGKNRVVPVENEVNSTPIS